MENFITKPLAEKVYQVLRYLIHPMVIGQAELALPSQVKYGTAISDDGKIWFGRRRLPLVLGGWICL